MVQNNTFTNCRCPHCKTSLHEVAETTPACPLCNHPLDARAVWLTRRDPGEIALPGWLKAFGWPFLLMLLGGILFGLRAAGNRWIPTEMAAAALAFGLVYFICILASNGDEV